MKTATSFRHGSPLPSHHRSLGVRVAIAGLLFSALSARTASAQCFSQCVPGSTGTSCSSSSDCGPGAVCVFSDACLPGAPELIQRVFPSADPYLHNDYVRRTGGWWGPNYTASGDEMIITPTKPESASWQIVWNKFQVPVGKRYFLSAEVYVEAGTWLQLELLGAGIPPGLIRRPEIAWSSRPVGTFTGKAPAWELAGVSFYAAQSGSDPTMADLELRLTAQGTGAGRVHVRRFALYEIAEQGTYVRVQVDQPAAEAHVDLRILRHPDPKVEGLAEGATLELSDVFGTIRPGETSSWLRLDTTLRAADRATVAFIFRDPSGAELSGVSARFQVATQPDASAVYFDAERSLSTGRVSLAIPESRYPVLGFKSAAAFVVDRIVEDHANLLATGAAPMPPLPSLYSIGTRFAKDPQYLDGAEEAAGPVLSLFRDLGMTMVNFGKSGNGLTTPEGTQAASLGIDRGFYYFRSWNPGGATIPFDLEALEDRIRDYAADSRGPVDLGTLFRDRPERAIVEIGDEIGGFNLGGIEYTNAFHQFLIAQGFSPESFGRTSWDELEPLHGLTPNDQDVLATRPANPASDPNAAKLWYWQIRFWNQATADIYRLVRTVVRTNPIWGADYPVIANQGLPWGRGDFTYRRGTEMLTFLKSGALSMPFGEDYINLYDYRSYAGGEQGIGLFADYFRAAALSAGTPLAAHITSGFRERKLLSWVARGAQHLHHYSYGTHDLEQANTAFGGYGEKSVPALREIREGNRLVASAQHRLAGGVRPASPIVFLAAQSDPLWSEIDPDDARDPATARHATTPEERGAYLAFRHGHFQVDYLFEEDLAGGALGPERRILVVNDRCLSDAAFGAIRSWVEAGGYLQLALEAALCNEYAQPAPDRAEWLQVAFGPKERADGTRVHWGSGASTTTITVDRRSTLTLLGRGTVIARYATGEAASVEVVRGRGRVRILGFDAGRSYLRRVLRAYGYAQAGYQTPAGLFVRDLAVYLALGQKRPAWTTNELVEAHRIDHPEGGAVILINFNDARVSRLRVAIPNGGSRITSHAKGLVLEPRYDVHGNAIVELDVDAGDILTWDSGS
jgi:hypothetical protein